MQASKLYNDSADDDLIDQLIGRVAPAARPTRHTIAAGQLLPKLAACADAAQDALVTGSNAQRHLADTERLPGPEHYRPLESVWHGEEDAELIEQLLDFYPRREPRLILDATVNGGRFWRGSTRPVIGLDIDGCHRPDVCADNAAIPFRSAAFDVVVYDPPHIPNQGNDRSKDFNKRFGLGSRSFKEHGYSFAHTYPAFMAEAWRVLIDEGVLLCKITDYVHNHRYQWAHVDLICAGRDAGFTACDCIIKVRKGPIIDPKWKTAHHSRRQHCYWVIFRKSNRCE